MYYFFVAALGFHCCPWAFSSCGHQSYSPLGVVSLVVVEHRL